MANERNLRAGNTTGLERDEAGRFTTARSEIGRLHALDILTDPEYRKALKRRMIGGDAGAVEVWVWRIGYGDPPRAPQEEGDDKERFQRRREAMQKFMKDHPEEAALLAKLVARGERPPATVLELVANSDKPPTDGA